MAVELYSFSSHLGPRGIAQELNCLFCCCMKFKVWCVRENPLYWKVLRRVESAMLHHEGPRAQHTADRAILAPREW